MVAIVIKYTAEELAPKAQKFYCGAGLVKCQIVSSEKGLSRFHTEEKPKEEEKFSAGNRTNQSSRELASSDCEEWWITTKQTMTII